MSDVWRNFGRRTFVQDFYSYSTRVLLSTTEFLYSSGGFFVYFLSFVYWSGMWLRRMKTFDCRGFSYTQSTHNYRLTATEHSCICMAECVAFQQRQEVRHMQRRLSSHTHTHTRCTHGCNLLSTCWICLSYQCVDFGPLGGEGRVCIVLAQKCWKIRFLL